MIARCCDCGAGFPRKPDEPWKVRCIPCWRSTVGATAGRRTSATPPASTTAVPVDATRVRQLIQLCHPDKHNQSDLAVQVTQWLLQLKAQVRT